MEKIYYPICELWGGCRFREISYCFDPEGKHILPAICTSCENIISAEMIENGEKLSSDISSVTHACYSCTQKVNLVFAYGMLLSTFFFDIWFLQNLIGFNNK